MYLYVVSAILLLSTCSATDEERSIKNDNCVFPFTYKGNTYNYCTKVNSNKLWCSLQGTYDGNWVYCEENKEEKTDKFHELFIKLKEQEKLLKAAELSSKSCRCGSEIKAVYQAISDIEKIITDHQRRLSGMETNLDKVESAEKEFNEFLPNLQKVFTYVTKY